MKHLESVLKQAKLFEKQGKFLHALQLYQTLLSTSKHRRIATVRLAAAYERLRKPVLARKLLERYIAENESDEELKKLFCHFLIRNDYNEDALFYLATISQEKNPEILYLMGIANYRLNNYEIAELNFVEYILENSNSDLLPEALFLVAKIQLELNKIDNALENANKSAELFFQSSETHALLARIYYKKEMYYHAQRSIKNAIKINSNEINLLKYAGKISLKLSEYNNAKDYLSQYLKKYKDDLETRRLLEECLNELGEKYNEELYSQ